MTLTWANGTKSLVVLVVEDQFLMRYDIVQHLRNSGCIVLEARSAEQAVVICRSTGVDVLLTDVNLNGSGSGWDVAEALRAARPRIGVVYVSSKSVDQSRRVNDSHFFYKPYRVADIMQACRDVADT
jgi:CheY-like chemotaxis protein